MRQFPTHCLLSITIFLVLAACATTSQTPTPAQATRASAPELAQSPTQQAATLTPAPTQTPRASTHVAIMTQSKTSDAVAKSPFTTGTPSIIPSQASPPIPNPTISVPINKRSASQALSGLMLSLNDYQTFDDIDLQYLAPELFETFFQEGAATITDASPELNSICLLECTKQVWATASEVTTGYGGEQVTVNRKVVIAMLRSKDETGAQKTAHNLYNEFIPLEYEYEDERNNVNAPIKNTQIGMDLVNNRIAVILTTSVGSITVWVMNYPNPLADDGLIEVDIATYFANLQILKLKNAGLVP